MHIKQQILWRYHTMLKIVGHLIIRKCFCLLQEGKGGEPNIKLEGRRVTGRSGIWVKKGIRRAYYMVIQKKLFRLELDE